VGAKMWRAEAGRLVRWHEDDAASYAGRFD
jgi:hypothetical protein